MKKLKTFIKYSFIFSIGAFLYCFIENLWRGHSHWSMAVAGGLVMSLIYKINKSFCKFGLFIKCGICSLIITVIEFLFGCIFNIWLKMKVWDYSSIPFNFLGQICPLYTFLWYLLSVPAIGICGMMKNRLFKD